VKTKIYIHLLTLGLFAEVTSEKRVERVHFVGKVLLFESFGHLRDKTVQLISHTLHCSEGLKVVRYECIGYDEKQQQNGGGGREIRY
jgi:hypothetical protein